MLNKVQLIGRLGKDPEVRTLTTGAMVASFSIATSEHWKDKTTGEKKESTEWHNIVIWRGLAEVAQKYLHKGDLIYIEGKMTTRSWEKDGVTRYTTEIVANEMKMLGGKKEGSGRPDPNPQYDPGPSRSTSTGGNSNNIPDFTPPNNSTDDLPF